jgi:hypothetical protein
MQSADVVFVTDQAVFRLFLEGIQSINVDYHILTSRDRITCTHPKSIRTKRTASRLRTLPPPPQASQPDGSEEREDATHLWEHPDSVERS